MSQQSSSFWINPPWGNGEEKYRLGLKPIEKSRWLDRKIDKNLLNYKKEILSSDYESAVACTDDSFEAQRRLADIFGVTTKNYPDLIADMSLIIQDDLCLIESKGKQRLIAASICSPSYWDVRTKIGKPLKEIHRPVTSLEEKIGQRISTFIKQAPVMRPFFRQNWLIHGDVKRFHLKEEKKLSSDPKDWYVRSEKETLCRFHEDYSLFTINVLFEPLKEVLKYPEAKNGLVKSLHSFDEDEEVYFGGKDKIKALLEYLKT